MTGPATWRLPVQRATATNGTAPASGSSAPRSALLTAAARFYGGQLRRSPGRVEYLASRGIGVDAALRLGLGYASGNGLREHLGSAGFNADRQRASGLFLEGGAERFAGMVVVPDIANGLVRWLVGRAVDAQAKPRFQAVPGPKPVLGLGRLGPAPSGNRRRRGLRLPGAGLLGLPRRAPPWAPRGWTRWRRRSGAAPGCSWPSTTTKRGNGAAAGRSRQLLGNRAAVVNLPRASPTWASWQPAQRPTPVPQAAATGGGNPASQLSPANFLSTGPPATAGLSFSPTPNGISRGISRPAHGFAQPRTASNQRATPTSQRKGANSWVTETTRTGNHSANGNGHHPNGAGHHPNGNRNGNGNGAADITGHDLLWDGLPRRGQRPAAAPGPGPGLPAPGPRQPLYDYIEGHTVIDQANRIFGYGGWGYELVGDVSLRRIEKVDVSTGELRVTFAYSAPVRVSVNGAPSRTDIGFHIVAEDTPEGHDTACKGAVTDGLKRALRSFGDRFGNGLYGDQPSSNGRGNGRQGRSGPTLPPTTATPASRRAATAMAGRDGSYLQHLAGDGSSPWARSRASTRTGCGRRCGSRRARTWTTCPPRT